PLDRTSAPIPTPAPKSLSPRNLPQSEVRKPWPIDGAFGLKASPGKNISNSPPVNLGKTPIRSAMIIAQRLACALSSDDAVRLHVELPYGREAQMAHRLP